MYVHRYLRHLGTDFENYFFVWKCMFPNWSHFNSVKIWSVANPANDPRARLTRHYTEDIPDVSLYEIRMALKQLKNNKAPGDDGITAELQKAGGKPILKALQKLFDSVILEGKTPQVWCRGVVVLFFKKGDNALLKNYRPITLLSHVYKLFSRVITNRLARRFDDFQPPEQAGFRKGFSTVDHIHTLRQVIQKTEEYNLPLCLAFVDYEKAFDSIETWTVLQCLQRCQIDYRYIEVLKFIQKHHHVSSTSGSDFGTSPSAARCETRRRHISETVYCCTGGCLQVSGLDWKSVSIT